MLNANICLKFFSSGIYSYFSHQQPLLLQQPHPQQPHARMIRPYWQEQWQSLQQRLKQTPKDLLQFSLRPLPVEHQLLHPRKKMIKICCGNNSSASSCWYVNLYSFLIATFKCFYWNLRDKKKPLSCWK